MSQQQPPAPVMDQQTYINELNVIFHNNLGNKITQELILGFNALIWNLTVRHFEAMKQAGAAEALAAAGVDITKPGLQNPAKAQTH